MQAKAIELKNVSKSFGSKRVLSGFDLEITRGESVVLLGQSGMGKSVMLRLVLGLLEPDSGTIKVDGRDISEFDEAQFYKSNRKIGMLFQNGALFDSMSVWENVAFSLLNVERIGADAARKIAIGKLAEVGLSEKIADMMPASLSGGMKKRVGLARAIANDPDIIFFDEPTTGLDPIMSDVINELILRSVKQLGATALTITHDINSARKIADRVVMLLEGKIIWSGRPEDLRRPNNEYVERFVRGISSPE
ncbi:MAG: ATP-binding cassette domain-containing protein [Rickettsiales bacterium]|jgi:phospholipid/cholesterol/gamma-HCH transport system ATP-binding protein|nr:ATP-binding cassette domain-containing protein [Rickettsiales bacterium]